MDILEYPIGDASLTMMIAFQITVADESKANAQHYQLPATTARTQALHHKDIVPSHP